MQIPWPHTFSKRVQIPEICLLTFQRSEKRKIITIHKDKCHYSSVYKVKYFRKREEYFIMFGKVRAGELLRQIFKAEQEMQPGSEDYFKAEFTRVNPKALGSYFTSCVIVARVCIFSAAVILIKMAFFFQKLCPGELIFVEVLIHKPRAQSPTCSIQSENLRNKR